MALTVLKDEEIRHIVESLTAEEAEEFRTVLKGALHDYSNGTQSLTDTEIHQPDRTSIHSSVTGATTLFMPSCSAAGVGIKVITLTSPTAGTAQVGNNRTAAADEEEEDDKPVIRPTGAITLFKPDGCPVGILHASTLTAFRTALSSACLLVKRNTVRTVVVFGAGQQAFWHVRLALLFRGTTIRNVHILNHRFSASCKAILKRLYAVPVATKHREGWADAQFSVLTPGYTEYERLQREHLRSADVIFCCTPSTQPLFDASILTAHEARRKGRLIVAIGSYAKGMRELPVELLHQATRTYESGHRHYHKHASEGGVIVVDTLDGALKEAGEVIEAGLSPKQLVELGELVMLRKMAMESEMDTASSSSTNLSSEFEKLDLSTSSSAMSSVFGTDSGSNSTPRSSSPSRTNSSSSPSRHRSHNHHHRRSASQGSIDRQKSKDDHLARWLHGGNVIYKSVGLGLMDLTVGMHLIEYARKKGIGSHIEGF